MPNMTPGIRVCKLSSSCNCILFLVKNKHKKTRPTQRTRLLPRGATFIELCLTTQSHSCGRYISITAPPGNGGDLPASLSLTLSGGFNAANSYRLALSRLHVHLPQP